MLWRTLRTRAAAWWAIAAQWLVLAGTFFLDLWRDDCNPARSDAFSTFVWLAVAVSLVAGVATLSTGRYAWPDEWPLVVIGVVIGLSIAAVTITATMPSPPQELFGSVCDWSQVRSAGR